MAYRIRYGRRLRRWTQGEILRLQWFGAAIVMLLAVFCGLAGGMWREGAQAVFLPIKPAAAAGKGWYDTLAALCREVLFGAD